MSARENGRKSFLLFKASAISTKVEHSNTDPDIKGLNPAAAQHLEKMAAKKLWIILTLEAAEAQW
jgi:hypothetical protein